MSPTARGAAPFLLLVLACMPAAAPPVPAPALACRLEAVPPLQAGGSVRVRFTLANAGDRPLYALAWNTPLEGWDGTIFEVTSGGAEVPYRGRRVKRGDPERDEYVEVPAGGEVAATVDLAEVYDLGAPGSYGVRIVGGLHDLTADASSIPRPRDRFQPAPLACSELALDVAAR